MIKKIFQAKMSSRNMSLLKSVTLPLLAVMLLLPARLDSQRPGIKAFGEPLVFGVHADPVISWFSSDIDSVRNDGARSGINFGITIYRFFGPNYAISTGLNLISTGGRLVTRDTTTFDLTSGVDPTVPGNTAIVYKIQYLSIPIGLKLQTNQIGYVTIFVDLGLDPKIVIGGKVDIDDLENQKAPGEIKNFNISYHALAGIEYGIGGNTAVVLGIGFDNNFADITKDYDQIPFNQPADKISHKMLSIRLGVNF
ncbi:MAG: PorT family protein [Bacteroidales bacterium]|jgi:hypothetical protein|nr:PorT family protein [Bacteroidales bacterium]